MCLAARHYVSNFDKFGSFAAIGRPVRLTVTWDDYGRAAPPQVRYELILNSSATQHLGSQRNAKLCM